MLFKQYYFRFSLLGTILAITGTALFTSLGVWQTYRALEKQQLQAEMDIKVQQPAFVLNSEADGVNEKKYLKTIATGFYDKSNEVLIDNTVHNGSAGYYVMTPLLLKIPHQEEQIVIMVNRGWVPVGRDRNILPELETPVKEIRIQGVITPPKSKPPLILGELDIQAKVWPYFDSEKYAKRIGQNIMPMIILLDHNDAHGYVREWPKYETKVGMHIGYAIQWYVFALIVIATYFGLNIKKRTLIKRDINDSRTDNA